MHQSAGRGAEAISMIRGSDVFRGADLPFCKQPLEEDLLVGILSGIPSSILIFDRSLRVVFANRNLLVKLRKGADEVLGKKIRDIFPPVILSYTNVEENLSKALTGKPLDGEEMEYRAPGLATRAYFYSLTPLRDQAGLVRNVMLFMDDVTEKKALGARMMRAERHLASVVESANDLIVSVNAAGAGDDLEQRRRTGARIPGGRDGGEAVWPAPLGGGARQHGGALRPASAERGAMREGSVHALPGEGRTSSSRGVSPS